MNKFDVAFSFDSTYSMGPCKAELRKRIKEVVTELLTKVPGMRVAITAHGDYWKESGFLYKVQDFTADKDQLFNFVNKVGVANGVDTPEAYEYVLRETQKLSWDSERCRVLVMIGDSVPHGPDDHPNPYKIDWRREAKELVSMGVTIYSMQCLDDGSESIRAFYRELAEIGKGQHIYLDQFSALAQVMTAICLKQLGGKELANYQDRLTNDLGGMPIALKQLFDVMSGRKTTKEIEEENAQRYDWGANGPAQPKHKKIAKAKGAKGAKGGDSELKPCRPSRFQICEVDKDVSIKEFAEENDLPFEAGRGFYEFTKPEIISKTKEVVLQRRDTGEIFEGAAARTLLGLEAYNEKARMAPAKFKDFRVFVQSTSYNRKLKAGTLFLYDTT